MKDYRIINEIKESQNKNIETAFDEGYKQGKSENADYRFEEGLNYAWECTRELYATDPEILRELFYESEVKFIIKKLSPLEIMRRLKEYKAKHGVNDEIKVGDEVYREGDNYKRVVLDISDSFAIQLAVNGKHIGNDVSELHKTGRHFSQIEEVIEQMRRCNDEINS